jgi:hypothetical protein
MPYFVQARMRAICDTGMLGFARSSRLTGAATSSGRTGAGGEIILSTRGFRADWRSPAAGIQELTARRPAVSI